MVSKNTVNTGFEACTVVKYVTPCKYYTFTSLFLIYIIRSKGQTFYNYYVRLKLECSTLSTDASLDWHLSLE